MTDAPKERKGLENIVLGSLMTAGAIAGDAFGTLMGFGPVGTAATTAAGMAVGGATKPAVYPLVPSFLENPVDKSHGRIGGSLAAIVTAAAAYNTLVTPLGWGVAAAYAALWAIPSYLAGKGLVGGYLTQAVDSIKSFIYGTNSAIQKAGKGLHEMGTKFSGSANGFVDNYKKSWGGLYQSFDRLASAILRPFGYRPAAPAAAGAHP